MAAELQGPAPDFKQVYDLVAAHLNGLSPEELNRKAVESLVSTLSPNVTLLSDDGSPTNVSAGLLVTASNLFEGGIAYVRIARVKDDLPQAVRQACEKVGSGTNQLNGIVLDLRFARGDTYAACASTADLFLKKEQPLLDWGEGVVRSKNKELAISVPVAVLINRETSGAAEALAAILRQTGTALLLGSRSAGQALIAQDYPLSNGERLRIATAPVRLGDGTPLSTGGGVQPDIAVEVNPQEERAYFADAFKDIPRTNVLANTIVGTGAVPNGTNRLRRARFNEAELVRERKEGADPDIGGATPETDKPVVRDPVLARALDLLKGLAVVRHSRS